MRIVMLSWEYPPKNVGGLSNHVYNLSHNLCEMGHEVHVITCQEGTAPIKELDKGVFVHRVEPYKIETNDFVKWVMQLNFAMIEETIRLIREKGKIDILHAHDWMSTYSAKVLKWSYNIPVLCTIHATEYGRNNGIKTEMQRYISSVEWNLTYESWKVIICSSYMREEVNRIFSVPWDKMYIVPNGINMAEFKEEFDKKEFKRKYAQDDEKIILYVGRHVFEKGIHILINTIPKILENDEKVKFILTGKGPITEELKEKVKAMDLCQKVIFTGYISDEEKNKLYRIADLAVFPSLYEPFGIVSLEAMAAGCPVIVSDTGGFSEIINHKVNGMKFICGSSESLKDNILEVLNNEELSKELNKEGLKNVSEKYSWNQIAIDTLNIYKQVLQENRGIEWKK